jgi:putative spermidine/putrescine transport system permease protein
MIDSLDGRPIARRLLELLPVAALLTVFFVAPLLMMFRYSLDRFTADGMTVSDLTAANYERFVTDTYFGGILATTLTLGLAVTVVSVALSYPLAYVIARGRPPLRTALIIIVLVPLMTGVVARSYGWTVLLGGSGVINKVLSSLGLPTASLMFSVPGTVIALVEVLMPFMVLSLLASLQHIDRTVEDAARSLGAPPWRVFADIVLPLSLPGLAAGSLLVFVQAISAFATPALIGGVSTRVMSTLVFTQATTIFNWPFAAAASFILLAIVATLTAIQGRLLRGHR